MPDNSVSACAEVPLPSPVRAAQARPTPPARCLRVSVQRLNTAHADVVVPSANRDEVVLLFASGDRCSAPATREINLNLHTRIALNPFAAKRLKHGLDRLFGTPPSPQR